MKFIFPVLQRGSGGGGGAVETAGADGEDEDDGSGDDDGGMEEDGGGEDDGVAVAVLDDVAVGVADAEGNTGTQGGPRSAQDTLAFRMFRGQHSDVLSAHEAAPHTRQEAAQHALRLKLSLPVLHRGSGAGTPDVLGEADGLGGADFDGVGDTGTHGGPREAQEIPFLTIVVTQHGPFFFLQVEYAHVLQYFGQHAVFLKFSTPRAQSGSGLDGAFERVGTGDADLLGTALATMHGAPLFLHDDPFLRILPGQQSGDDAQDLKPHGAHDLGQHTSPSKLSLPRSHLGSGEFGVAEGVAAGVGVPGSRQGASDLGQRTPLLIIFDGQQSSSDPRLLQPICTHEPQLAAQQTVNLSFGTPRLHFGSTDSAAFARSASKRIAGRGDMVDSVESQDGERGEWAEGGNASAGSGWRPASCLYTESRADIGRACSSGGPEAGQEARNGGFEAVRRGSRGLGEEGASKIWKSVCVREVMW